MAARGQKAGQPIAGVALDWADYVDGLIDQHGSLAAVSERVAALRSHREDVESVARALRRLRARGTRPGGVWGDRLLLTFGLPVAVADRLRFMGQYHSRFVDLPLPIAADLVALWDRPPTSDSPDGRAWLSLARATLAFRSEVDAAAHLETAARAGSADPAAAIELALGRALLAARARPERVADVLAEVPPLLERVGAADRDCLRARHAGQVAHAWFRSEQVERGLAIHLALPDEPTTHPFARSRRANGIAYGLLRRGDAAAARLEARRAATFAGDAGHVRLLAMALLMLSRIGGDDDEAEDARSRAAGIARALGDARLERLVAPAARDRSRPPGTKGPAPTR